MRTFLLKNNCDDFEFQLNVPSASHMGGVWERQIRTVCNVLRPLLDKHGDQLDDNSLCTLFYEVMSIVNSRPLSVSDLCDPLSPEVLTPNHILTMKTKVVLPPPEAFPETDVYNRKRWRRVQHLLNVFWSDKKTGRLNTCLSYKRDKNGIHFSAIWCRVTSLYWKKMIHLAISGL